MNQSAGPLPLAGVRVIEVSSFIAAPLAGMTLAQLGADVIRVDPIGGAADRYRWPLSSETGESLYWAGLNRGKKSITVNFSSPEGRQVIEKLISSCPAGSAVVLTNAIGRPWLSYDSLQDAALGLIHVQVEGASDGSSAVDYTVNAEVGFPFITGGPGQADPVNHVLPAWDIACGLYCALAVVAAVRNRDLTGRGESIKVALKDVALATAGSLGFLAEAQLNETDRQRIGNHLYGGFARDFECADGGRLMIVALTERQWRELVEVTQTGQVVAALETALETDFRNESDRYEHREVLAALLARWFARRTLAQASDELGKTGILWSRYRTFRETVASIQSGDESDLFSALDQPGIGTYFAPKLPVRFASFEGSVVQAPLLGGETLSILNSLGESADDISRLHESRIVGEISKGFM